MNPARSGLVCTEAVQHYGNSRTRMVGKRRVSSTLDLRLATRRTEYWARDSHFISTPASTLSLPGFNMPSFILHFSEDPIYFLSLYISIYLTDTFFALSLAAPPPSLCRPTHSKAIIPLPFPLYLHDTEVLSEAGAGGKRWPFTKWFRFNIFPALFITTRVLYSRTNSPRVIASSLCKYHGPSLIFILLPPLSLKTPSVDQYHLGLRAGRRQSHITDPRPAQNKTYETQRTFSV